MTNVINITGRRMNYIDEVIHIRKYQIGKNKFEWEL